MGNASGKEEGGVDAVEDGGRSNGGDFSYPADYVLNPNPHGPVMAPADMGTSPPASPGRSRSPVLSAPQVPVAPLQRGDGHPFYNSMWSAETQDVVEFPPQKGIPTLITWSHGGNHVAVEGSWDNWKSRRVLQRSGKDHSLLLVLPLGIYHYKFIVDGELRYMHDLPCVTDEMGHVFNVLDVNDYVPESLDSVAEFEAPASPDSSYSQSFPGEEDYAKEPLVVPSQLHLTVLGTQNADEAAVTAAAAVASSSSSKPQHVVLNHLFIEKGWASQSVVALGLTHRFQSKYVTVVLYKPLKSKSKRRHKWEPSSLYARSNLFAGT